MPEYGTCRMSMRVKTNTIVVAIGVGWNCIVRPLPVPMHEGRKQFPQVVLRQDDIIVDKRHEREASLFDSSVSILRASRPTIIRFHQDFARSIRLDGRQTKLSEEFRAVTFVWNNDRNRKLRVGHHSLSRRSDEVSKAPRTLPAICSSDFATLSIVPLFWSESTNSMIRPGSCRLT